MNVFRILVQMVLFLVGAVVAAMFAVGGDTYLESDGDAVTVGLTATVTAKQVAYAEAWLGITNDAGDSGDQVALTTDMREYQFTVPSGLSVSKGDVVYVDTAQVTGHTPDDAAYSTSSGSGKIKLFKATADKDANNIVTGVLLSKLN